MLLTPDGDEIEVRRLLMRWSDGKFNPDRFDIAKTDKAVRGALRKRRLYSPARRTGVANGQPNRLMRALGLHGLATQMVSIT